MSINIQKMTGKQRLCLDEVVSLLSEVQPQELIDEGGLDLGIRIVAASREYAQQGRKQILDHSKNVTSLGRKTIKAQKKKYKEDDVHKNMWDLAKTYSNLADFHFEMYKEDNNQRHLMDYFENYKLSGDVALESAPSHALGSYLNAADKAEIIADLNYETSPKTSVQWLKKARSTLTKVFAGDLFVRANTPNLSKKMMRRKAKLSERIYAISGEVDYYEKSFSEDQALLGSLDSFEKFQSTYLQDYSLAARKAKNLSKIFSESGEFEKSLDFAVNALEYDYVSLVIAQNSSSGNSPQEQFDYFRESVFLVKDRLEHINFPDISLRLRQIKNMSPDLGDDILDKKIRYSQSMVQELITISQ